MPNLIDLTGKIFGNIRCDSQAESKSGKRIGIVHVLFVENKR